MPNASWNTCTYLALRPLHFHLLRLPRLRLLLNHPQQRITPPLELLGTPALEEPIEPEHRELRDILLDAFVHVLRRHTVMVQPHEQVPVLFFRVDFAFRRGVVELELLHRVAYGVNLLGEERFEVGSFVPFGLAFFDTCFDTGVFYTERQPPA